MTPTDPSAVPSPASRPAATPAQIRSARIQILLMVLVFAAPVALSYLWYFVVHPVDGRNYGTLLDVHPLPEAQLVDADGAPLVFSSLRGKWLLVAEDGIACGPQCQDKLYAMRQVRAALGHDDLRVERVLLLDEPGALSPRLQQDYRGTRFLRPLDPAFRQAFTAEHGDLRAHLWVVDPLGNLVLRYPANPDLKRMLKDMERLLKASQIG